MNYSTLKGNMLFIIVLFSLSLKAQYPAPAVPADTTHYGEKISRSLALMGTSTPTNNKKVRVLVYGQSISEQDWWDSVHVWLDTQYPDADIEMKNLAVGGYSSQMLWRITEMDVTNFYPDLVIFHVYGNHYFYETVMRLIRGRTTAEILVQADHIGGSENDLDLSDMSNWSNKMCFQTIPGYADTYYFELMDSRTQWKDYLVTNAINSVDLTTDGTHLNDHGNYLQAKLTEQHLVYKPKFEEDPEDLCTIYEVGTDVTASGGKITLPFTGNKVEIVPEQQLATTITVLVDGKTPGEFPTCYNISRPMRSGSFWNGGFTAKPSIAPTTAQDWTLQFTSDYDFSLTGSVTGADGTGNANNRFVSNSGQVVIHPKDWWQPLAWGAGSWQFSNGDQITWSSFGMFNDTIDFNSVTITANEENPINLVQGLPDGEHTLELTSTSGDFPIKYIKVYNPSTNLHITPSDTLVNTTADGGTESITIKTNTFWQVFDTISWISVDLTDNYSYSDDLKLLDSMTMEITISPNTTGTSRNADIYLSGIGEYKKVSINQSVFNLIDESELTDKTYGDASFPLSHDATGETVVYSSGNNDIASISGNTVTINGAGTVDISAQIEGDASSLVTKPLVVAKKELQVSTPDVARDQGTENPVFTVNYSGFVNGDDENYIDIPPTVGTLATATSSPGTYPIAIIGASDDNYSFSYTNGTLTVNAVTGFFTDKLDVTVFPNPSKNILNIKGLKEEARISIYSLTGVLVKEKIFHSETTIPVDDLSTGVYIIQVWTSSGMLTKNLMIE